MRKATIDAADHIREIEEEEIPELEEAQQELVDAVVEEFGSVDDAPPELQQKWKRLEEEKVELRGERNGIRMDLVEWSEKYDLHSFTKGDRDWDEVDWDAIETEFRLNKMNAATFADVADRITAESFDFDFDSQSVDGTPKNAAAQILTVKRSLISWPSGAPVADDGLARAGEYDNKHIEWLFDKANNLNTVGDTDLGNSSFREAVNSAKS